MINPDMDNRKDLEVIHEGNDDVMQLDSLACCFPAGTLSVKGSK